MRTVPLGRLPQAKHGSPSDPTCCELCDCRPRAVKACVRTGVAWPSEQGRRTVELLPFNTILERVAGVAG